MQPGPERNSCTEADQNDAFIVCEQLSKVYPMGLDSVVALNDVSFQVQAGAFVAIVGRSGSGKSTLLHLLAGLDQPSAGFIRVGEWNLSGLGRQAQVHYRRTTVGMVFQDFNLVPSMTALDNVALPLVLAGQAPRTRRKRALDCLHAVGLADRALHKPTQLSGGEQQRVAIARALVHDPPLLLADEPTGNLDSTTGAAIIELLARVQQERGKTILIITHQPDEVAHVIEQQITLHDGKIV